MATVAIGPDQDTIIAEIFIAAPPARVFEAITDPNQMPQWWGEHGIHRITAWTADLRPGGKWSGSGTHADGTPFTIEGEYLEVDPPRLLVHTWSPSWTGPLQTVVRWELEPHAVHGLHPSGPRKAGTGTLLRVRQEGFAGAAAALAGHSKGWKSVLGWLQGFLERGETVEMRNQTTPP
jgi:uncharacterized protein YndB with AHSA1/START domain